MKILIYFWYFWNWDNIIESNFIVLQSGELHIEENFRTTEKKKGVKRLESISGWKNTIEAWLHTKFMWNNCCRTFLFFYPDRLYLCRHRNIETDQIACNNSTLNMQKRTGKSMHSYEYTLFSTVFLFMNEDGLDIVSDEKRLIYHSMTP